MADRQDVVSLLEELIAIDSSNPGLAEGAPGEEEIARFVTTWAERCGLAVEPVGPNDRPSVLVRGGRNQSGRRLLLCGHLDTVGLAGVQDPLVPQMDGDRLFGRGAYDMKAGLAAALIACRDAVEAGISGEMLVGCVADEEYASVGVQDLLGHLGDTAIDAAIVTEPTERAIGTAHRGFAWVEVVVTGRAAHGSRPHLGVDAIMKAGPVLVGCAELDDRVRARAHPFLGPGNLHASLIAGGTEESTIPDRCSVVLERRTLPGETGGSVLAELEEVLDRCRAADPDLDVVARTTLVRDPFETPEGAPVVDAVRDAHEQVTGGPAVVAPMSYWADSAFLASAGIPTVLYGPEGDGAHADVEWVSVSGTRACTEVLTRVAISLTG
jgi:acetylornithine deacetylase